MKFATTCFVFFGLVLLVTVDQAKCFFFRRMQPYDTRDGYGSSPYSTGGLGAGGAGFSPAMGGAGEGPYFHGNNNFNHMGFQPNNLWNRWGSGGNGGFYPQSGPSRFGFSSFF